MGKSAIITEQQKDLLTGVTYNGGVLFSPIEDLNGDWVISEEEIDSYIADESSFLKEFKFLKKLKPKLKEHKAKYQ